MSKEKKDSPGNAEANEANQLQLDLEKAARPPRPTWLDQKPTRTQGRTAQRAAALKRRHKGD